MKITKISIKNFKAFQLEQTITLHNGKNLLLYGENGSGKSSLFQALDMFLSPNEESIATYKNIFVETDEEYVKLEIGDTKKPSDKFDWEETSHPSKIPFILNASKTKGFLDYKALLKTHFVHPGNNVNIFDLLINTIFANIENQISHRNFKDDYNQILSASEERRSETNTYYINSRLQNFNSGLTDLLVRLTAKANEIIALFDQKLTIIITLKDKGLIYDPDDIPMARLRGEFIELKVNYINKPIDDHHHFLNEARLSAIAISIYLAALLLNPPSELQILFLDDVLIGLDMSNRLPLLEILERFFPEWQIILTTYDRVWFEMAQQRVNQAKWQCDELLCKSIGEHDIPFFKGNSDYLPIANKHLKEGDLKAAAIYIRCAYERCIKKFCDEHHLAVRYCENPKEQKSEDFWRAVNLLVTEKTYEDGSPILIEEVIKNTEFFRSTILNQLSHTAPINLHKQEVNDAYTAITNLQTALRTSHKRILIDRLPQGAIV